MKVAVVTLGCPKNLVDSEVMTGLIKEAGFELTGDPGVADAIIVNTCGFIEDAKEESIETVLELARYKEEGRCRRLIMAGCLSQRYHKELMTEMPEVDHFVGTGEIGRIADILRGIENERSIVGNPTYLYDASTPRLLSSTSGSAYVKIAEGCSNHCSYCTIPLVRGEFRSRKVESVEREVMELALRGVREINLIAQDTTSYGRDGGDGDLVTLLKRLVQIDGIEWIRLLYLHPARLGEDLLRVIRDEEKICKYVDLPLQHIDDRILRAMGRGVGEKEIRQLIERIREIIPGVTLRTTFIVGFPGEDEEAFEKLLDFVEEMEFDRLGAFTYSREEGTVAYRMEGQVSERVKKRRYRELMLLQREIALRKNRGLIGSIQRALVEGVSDESPYLFQARVENQAPDVDGITYIARGEVGKGEMVSLLITDAGPYDLVGEVAEGIA